MSKKLTDLTAATTPLSGTEKVYLVQGGNSRVAAASDIVAGSQPLDADLTSWAGVTRASGFDTFAATPSSANLRALLTDEVGTGAAYFVGGALGTPASGTATNLTGLPVASGISGLASGMATFLAGGTSAQLAAALTDETGTGAAVFGTAPTIAGIPVFTGIPLLTGGAISFPATQIPSAGANDLDDYEEGTFTPVITGTTTAGTATYAEQNGRYTKIGRLVFFEIGINWNSHTGTGNISITGLPFAAGSAPSSRAVSVLYSVLVYSGDPTALISAGGTTISPRVMSSGSTTAQIAMVSGGLICAQGYYST